MHTVRIKSVLSLIVLSIRTRWYACNEVGELKAYAYHRAQKCCKKMRWKKLLEAAGERNVAMPLIN
jgi:hypothetical protein